MYVPYNEPFGLIPLEAALYAKPTIGSNMGGIRENIVDGKTGLLVSPDPQAIGEAMAFFCRYPEKRREMGKNAFNHVKKEFNNRNMVCRLGQRLLEMCV